MAGKKGSKNKRGRPPKSAKRKGKAVTPEAPKPTSVNALDFLYDQIVMKGGLQSIEKKMHGPIFNAFQLVETDLKRVPELEKKSQKEEKTDPEK